MLKNIFLFIIFFFNCDVYAQQWEWARKADGTASNESPKRIRSDGFGNLYLFGGGNGGSQYGNTILAPGDFIVKFNSSGAVIWAENINFTGSNISDFNVDSVGNIYFVGQYFNSLNVLSFNFISNGQEDIYIIKLDPSGTPLWGRSFGGIEGASPGKVTIDNNQNVYIDGNFRKSISFDAHTLTDTIGHFFLTKLNSSGNTIWATKGDASFWSGGLINFDKYSNIYVVGYTNDYYGYFFARFDSSGNLHSQHLLFGMYDYIPDFVISDNGNIFLLHNGVGHYGYLPILVKYDSLMNEQWSRVIGTYYGCYQFGAGVFIDKFENIYVGGSIGSTFCSQDSIYFQNQLAYIGHNGVPAIVKFSSSGNFIWIKEAISTDYDGIWTMSQDKSGNLYAAGLFNYPTNGYGDTLIFDNYTLIDDGNWQQIFVAKLNPSNIITQINKTAFGNSIEIFPNPSSGIFTIDLKNKTVSTKICVYDVLGSCLMNIDCRNNISPRIDLSRQPKGIYFIEIISDEVRSKNKIVLQ